MGAKCDRELGQDIVDRKPAYHDSDLPNERWFIDENLASSHGLTIGVWTDVDRHAMVRAT